MKTLILTGAMLGALCIFPATAADTPTGSPEPEPVATAEPAATAEPTVTESQKPAKSWLTEPMSDPDVVSTSVKHHEEARTSEGKPKFSFKPMARILADGAVYAPDGNGFTDGVQLPDMRIGLSAAYGNWNAKVDVGFGGFKLSIKDVFIQYKINDKMLVRGGYFVHQFGLQSSTSSSFKSAFEAPTTDDYLAATARNLGIMYNLSLPKFFMGTSVIFGNSDNLTGDGITRQSIGGVGRFVWRPIARDGAIVQVGMSAWYQSPTHKRGEDGKSQSGAFNLGANFPTRVAKVKMLGADVTDAGNQLKLSPELLLCKDRVALEAQYYYMNINRIGRPAYQVQGAYAWLRCLILGDSQYSYSPWDAGIAIPKPRTLELVAGYDYTNASHKDIRGGISNDYSVTLNYYFNKYMLARLGWRYTDVRDSSVSPKRHVNIIQLRLQFKF